MNRNLTILLVEDNPDDLFLLQRAFQKIELHNPIQTARNGEEAICYLEGAGPFSDRAQFPFPSLIISDLHMPKVGGMEILQWLRSHPNCYVIPVLILTASAPDQELLRAYQLGANACLRRPAGFDELVQMLKSTYSFWCWCQKPDLPKIC